MNLTELALLIASMTGVGNFILAWRNQTVSLQNQKAIEVVRHATNSLLDARVKSAEDTGARKERDRQEEKVAEGKGS